MQLAKVTTLDWTAAALGLGQASRRYVRVMCVGLKLHVAATIVSEAGMMLSTACKSCPALQVPGYLSCSSICPLLARPITLPQHLSHIRSYCRQCAHRVCLQCGADCSPPVHAGPPDSRFQVFQASINHSRQHSVPGVMHPSVLAATGFVASLTIETTWLQVARIWKGQNVQLPVFCMRTGPGSLSGVRQIQHSLFVLSQAAVSQASLFLGSLYACCCKLNS